MFKKNVSSWFKTTSVTGSCQIVRPICELILEGKNKSVVVETVGVSSLQMILWRNYKCFKGAAVF